LFNALDVASRPRNEADGKNWQIWMRSSGGKSNRLGIAVTEEEGIAPNGLTLVHDLFYYLNPHRTHDVEVKLNGELQVPLPVITKKSLDDRMLEILTSRILLNLSSSAKRALYQLS
jgi:hypothetical protein